MTISVDVLSDLIYMPLFQRTHWLWCRPLRSSSPLLCIIWESALNALWVTWMKSILVTSAWQVLVSSWSGKTATSLCVHIYLIHAFPGKMMISSWVWNRASVLEGVIEIWIYSSIAIFVTLRNTWSLSADNLQRRIWLNCSRVLQCKAKAVQTFISPSPSKRHFVGVGNHDFL